MGTEIVQQSNMITSARYDFSLLEKRIIYLIAAQLNGSKNLFEGIDLHLPIKRILKPTEDTGSNNYEQVLKAAERLLHRTYKIVGTNENSKRFKIGVAIISSYRIVDGKGLLEVSVDKHIVPYFAELLNTPQVTKLNLNNALSLKSTYSQRLYEFCSRFKDTGWWKVSVEELREMLELEGKFSTWGNLKERVLETAKKELEKKSDIHFKYYTRKTGKQITHLEFKIFKKDAAIVPSVYIMSSKLKENAALVQRLLQLGLSDKQVKEIFKLVDVPDINKTVHDILIAKQNGKIQTTPAAYSWHIFKTKYLNPQAA